MKKMIKKKSVRIRTFTPIYRFQSRFIGTDGYSRSLEGNELLIILKLENLHFPPVVFIGYQ